MRGLRSALAGASTLSLESVAVCAHRPFGNKRCLHLNNSLELVALEAVGGLLDYLHWAAAVIARSMATNTICWRTD
jgi:hypothetical protein